MKFRIIGADRQTGDDVEEVIEAATSAEAEAAAHALGILIERVEAVHVPPIPMPPRPAITAKTTEGSPALGGLIILLGLAGVYWLFFVGGDDEGYDPPPPASTSAPDLSADMQFTGTQFIITNRNSFDWVDVELEINAGVFGGGYNLQTSVIEAGTKYSVGAMQFAKSDGTRLDPVAVKPLTVWITCKVDGQLALYRGKWN